MLYYYFCKVITVAIKIFITRSLRADAQRLQQANRADTERLQQENRSVGISSLVYLFYMEPSQPYFRSLRADTQRLQQANRADTERLQQAHEAEIKSLLESTSTELQQTLQAKDSIIGGLQEQLDHLRKSHTAQVSHM